MDCYNACEVGTFSGCLLPGLTKVQKIHCKYGGIVGYALHRFPAL